MAEIALENNMGNQSLQKKNYNSVGLSSSPLKTEQRWHNQR